MAEIINDKQRAVEQTKEIAQDHARLDQSRMPNFDRSLIGGDMALRYGGMPNTGYHGKGSFSFQSRNIKGELEVGEPSQDNAAGERSFQPFMGGGVFQSAPESLNINETQSIYQSESPAHASGVGYTSFSTEPDRIDYQAELEDLPTVSVFKIKDGAVIRAERRSAEQDLNLAA